MNGAKLSLFCSVQHEQSNAVIDDQMHQDFLAHHRRGLTPQDIHTHGGFDIAEAQFNIPTSVIKISDISGTVGFCIG